jgi:hypothetical protein
MMIAKNWITSRQLDSVNVEGHRYLFPIPSPTSSDSIWPEKSGRFLPNRRDREVPYGMKGGERNGH